MSKVPLLALGQNFTDTCRFIEALHVKTVTVTIYPGKICPGLNRSFHKLLLAN